MPQVTLVRTASPEETLELVNEWQYQEWEIPKLMLVDLYLLTREAGLQLVQTLKAMPFPFGSIPLLILSASADTSDIAEAYSWGITAYLVKPMEATAGQALLTEFKAYWWDTVHLPPLTFSGNL